VGHKTHPVGFRIGTQFQWQSNWFTEKNYLDFLHEDLKIRKFLEKKLQKVGLDRAEIERSLKKIKINIFVAKPGMVIGRAGSGIEEIRKQLEKISAGKVQVSVSEVKTPDLSANLIAHDIARQIERRLPAKRILNGIAERIMGAKAKGTRLEVNGRLGGAEMARTEKIARGSVPLQTLNAEIDFARSTAFTKYGTIGVKVWINRGIKSVRKKNKGDKEKAKAEATEEKRIN